MYPQTISRMVKVVPAAKAIDDAIMIKAILDFVIFYYDSFFI
jgi:hypothetical protein